MLIIYLVLRRVSLSIHVIRSLKLFGVIMNYSLKLISQIKSISIHVYYLNVFWKWKVINEFVFFIFTLPMQYINIFTFVLIVIFEVYDFIL